MTFKTAPFDRSFDLHGKVAIVTGGAVGIGAACAARLAELGAKVAILDRDAVHAEQTTEELRVEGESVQYYVCDLGQVSSIERAMLGAVEALGGVDILVNNAGVFPIVPALDLSEKTWDHVLAVNLKGAFFASQLAARRMIAQGRGGSIVNVASIDAFHPSGALVHYDASKGGMVMMTRSLAKELAGHRIRVNAVAPGAIDTPGASAVVGSAEVKKSFEARIPLGRMGLPDDIARAVAFLATEAASYVTGSTLVVDGGFLVG